MSDPADCSADQEHAEPRPWGQLQYDRHEPQPADQHGNLIPNAKCTPAWLLISRGLHRIEDMRRPRIAVGIKWVAEARDSLPELQPLSNGTSDISGTNDLA